MFCVQCGNNLSEQVNFCPKCGYQVGTKDSKKIDESKQEISKFKKSIAWLTGWIVGSSGYALVIYLIWKPAEFGWINFIFWIGFGVLFGQGFKDSYVEMKLEANSKGNKSIFD